MMFSPGQAFQFTYTISQEVYDSFLKTSLDFNPLHTQDDFAQSKGFSGRVMHGNILNAFLSHFIGEGLPTKNVMILTQDIAFKKPSFLGDVLALNATVEEVHESVKMVTFKYFFAHESGEKRATGRISIKYDV